MTMTEQKLKFLADMDVAYMAHMLRELGYDAESVHEVRDSFKGSGEQRMYKDNAIAKYAAKTGHIIITGDWAFYYRLRKINQPAFLLAFHKFRDVISKWEHVVIVLSHYFPVDFRQWLITRYSFGKDLKYEGDWDLICKTHSQKKIDQIYNYDALGYLKAVTIEMYTGSTSRRRYNVKRK
jgi:Mut7-C RNAse domain